jgi:predicted DCC family thiol-disulfide oxidoreductase YuxK
VEQEHPIVLIDGVCHLCQGLTRFVILHDPAGIFRFASLQSDAGRRLLEDCGYLSEEKLSETREKEELQTIVLIESGRYFVRSEAVLRIAARLSFPWKMAAFLRIVPPVIREALYRVVARNRYRWFGKDDRCLVPEPEWLNRFLH